MDPSPRRALPPRWLDADGGVAAVTARGAVTNRMEGPYGQVKANRIIRKAGAFCAQRRPQLVRRAVKLKPARQGRRAATAPQEKRRETKQARVIALLERDTGATLDELIAATGWLPHTTRAALTGLRHKGFVLDRDKREDGTTVYRISSAPAASSPPKRADAMAQEDTTALEDEIARLRGLDLAGLQARWRTMFGRRAPAHLPKHLLLRIMAYRLQADVHGDLDPATVRSLDRLAKAGSDKSAPLRRQAPSGPAPCWSASGMGCSIASWRSMRVLPGMGPPTGACLRWPAPSPARAGTDLASSACARSRDEERRSSACAAPSTPGSRPSMGWSRTSTPSTRSARPPRPTSRAKPMRAGS